MTRRVVLAVALAFVLGVGAMFAAMTVVGDHYAFVKVGERAQAKPEQECAYSSVRSCKNGLTGGGLR